MPADPRFHPSAGPQRLEAVVLACGGRSDGPAGQLFEGVAALGDAGATQVSFLEKARLAGALARCRAGAVVVRADAVALLPAGCIAIVSLAPAAAFATIARLFHPAPAGSGLRHPTADIAPGARLADDVDVGAFAVIGEGAEIGPGCIIHPHVTVGPGVVLGARCILHSHASISHAICGGAVTLHPGARVGQEGFGFTPTAPGQFTTMPQLGRVVLEDRVEVGANSCIDRGALGDTVIGAGSRIDNLVQVGHNVRLGSGCVLVAMAGIAGSAVLEDGVQMGGQAAVAGHLRIGAGARIAGQAGVIDDVAAGADMFGSPAQPARQAMRELATLRRLAATAQKGDKAAARKDDQELPA